MKYDVAQDAALKKAKHWFHNSSDQVFYWFGYAGTGKTTLARELAEGIDGEVIFAAYTGKAAHVLKTKGCHNARTIHSLIYKSRDKSRKRLKELEYQLSQLLIELRQHEIPEQEIQDHVRVKMFRREIKQETENSDQPHFVLNHESDIMNAVLVVIDECSMVDERMGEDLLSFGIKILVLGDPAQLPPVGGAGYFTEGITPDVMLTEIHRQAEENPILRIATMLRNQQMPQIGRYGDSCVILDADTRMEPEQVLAFDQLLVGRNKTRHASNKRIRHLKGLEGGYPVVEDRLVCLRNDSELGLLNGQIFFVTNVDGVYDQKVAMSVCPEDHPMSIDVHAHEHHFLGKSDELKWFEKREAQEFDFGYALTVHKSQGSQWNNVLLFDESGSFKKDRWRWFYTGATRAAQGLTIKRMP